MTLRYTQNLSNTVPPTFHRDRFTWLAYLLLAFYSYFLNVMGPITPFLKSELSLSYTVASLHFSALAAGILLAGFTGHIFVRRVGRIAGLWTGAFGMGLGALVLILGRSPAVTIPAAFLMGLLGSLILVIVPAALSDRHGALRAIPISESNVVASLAATLAPLLVGFFAASLNAWRAGMACVAVLPLVLYVITRRGDVVAPPGARHGEGLQQGGRLPFLFWLYWSALVLAVAIEFCMILWSADYLENVLGLGKANAAQAVSLFLGGMIVGRYAGSRLVRRFSETRLVTADIVIAAAGFICFWAAPAPPMGLAGLAICGLGVGSMYPMLLALAMSTAGANTVQAGARATLASGAGILALPLVLGRLADALGIRAAYGVEIVLLLALFAVSQLAARGGFPARVAHSEHG